MSRFVIVGAGILGSRTALALAEAGHDVRLVSRRGRGPAHPRVEAVAAPAQDPARLAELTAGARALYNCANPDYWTWETEWPPLAASLLTAARQTGATLVAAGNLYGYGQGSGPMSESTPLATTSRKGRVRVQMWEDMLAAQTAGDVRVCELRASDYFGPGAHVNAHLGERVFPRVLAGKKAQFVTGNERAPHSWTYVPDFVSALALAGTDERAWGRAWHVPTEAPRTPGQAVSDIASVAGVRDPGYQAFPNPVRAALGVFQPFMRELGEVRYQFNEPFVLDSSAWTATFDVGPTPWREALLATVEDVRDGASAAA